MTKIYEMPFISILDSLLAIALVSLFIAECFHSCIYITLWFPQSNFEGCVYSNAVVQRY